MRPIRYRALLGALALVALAACTTAPRAPRGMRALWVTRWDYRTAEDVQAIVESSHAAGFDTLLFQVRGEATAFYRSAIEPWAAELGGRDPGFDPLALAAAEAHARGMALHAWVNVVPAVFGLDPPRDPAHVWNAHPEWLWVDQHGARQPLCDGFYASLNPCLPEVRAYLAAVAGEIATRYPIDGLHLDYLRFPNEPPAVPRGADLDYPRDERTLALFRAATGREPDEDRPAWDRWRTAQVTRLLREIRARLDRDAPGVLLSAAVGADPVLARGHFQDVEAWLREDLLDLVFPMHYTADPALFSARLAEWAARPASARVVLGLMAGGAPPEARRAQLLAAAPLFPDRALFAYHLLFDSRNTVLAAQGEEESRVRARRREILLPAFE
ncbi:MAG: family 10 glycosylhydrolase [Planctomycetota bacterium]